MVKKLERAKQVKLWLLVTSFFLTTSLGNFPASLVWAQEEGGQGETQVTEPVQPSQPDIEPPVIEEPVTPPTEPETETEVNPTPVTPSNPGDVESKEGDAPANNNEGQQASDSNSKPSEGNSESRPARPYYPETSTQVIEDSGLHDYSPQIIERGFPAGQGEEVPETGEIKPANGSYILLDNRSILDLPGQSWAQRVYYLKNFNLLAAVADPQFDFALRNLQAMAASSQDPQGIHQAVQSLLDSYQDLPVYIYFQMDMPGDQRYAQLRGDQAIYGASTVKIILAAYTQDRIDRGLAHWSDELVYKASINERPESFDISGSGTIQNEDPENKAYTLQDVVYRTMVHSDNIGSNMLLNYMGYADLEDFDRFTQEVYGVDHFALKVSPKELSQVMLYLAKQNQGFAFKALSHTDYDGTKLDVVDTDTHQKIGAWYPNFNHTVGIVNGYARYQLTIMSDYLSDGEIGQMVAEIDAVVNGR